MPKVADLMTKDIEIVTPDTPLKEAAMKMKSNDTGFFPVGENDRLVGTVTDRDIVIYAVAEGKDYNNATVKDAFTKGVHYVFEDQDVSEAIKEMKDRQLRRLPVLNRDKRITGVLSLGDVATGHGDQGQVAGALKEVSDEPKHVNK
ncbi:hypothetical protein DFJ74DRAFT_702807 [Hyaloraphidium curvatum]|nr:hypothetical protein DFJ74DRAFT_702807 [Hyaloraphidium curvatum]